MLHPFLNQYSVTFLYQLGQNYRFIIHLVHSFVETNHHTIDFFWSENRLTFSLVRNLFVWFGAKVSDLYPYFSA